MRNTNYAREIETATLELPDGTQARAERLEIKAKPTEKIEVRLSWWGKNRTMIPRPLDLTEDEWLALFREAFKQDVFSAKFGAGIVGIFTGKASAPFPNQA
jgi:hypothetical protein